MDAQHHYGTVTEAIEQLKAQGFTVDFNLTGNALVSSTSENFESEHFEIVEVYRYEGDSDPGDEATVYAIESNTGIKGILVMGYGISSEGIGNEILTKLKSK